MRNANLFLLLILLFSCSSNDDSLPSETYYRLVKVDGFTAEDIFDFTTIFEYDSNNHFRLSKSITDMDIKGDQTVYYSYDSNNRLNNYTIDSYSIVEFEYEGNLIVKKTSDVVIVEYHYNSLEQMILSISPSNDCVVEYDYNSNGNVTNFYQSCQDNTYSVSYDNKKNPYELVYPEGFYKINVKSINNRTFYTLNNSNIIYTYNYLYNTEGYPIKKSYYRNDELTGYLIYEYEFLED